MTNEQGQKMLEILNATIFSVKMACGIGNNAAWMCCLDAFDQIRKHPRINQSVKGGGTVRRGFKRCFAEFKRYEKQLVYGLDSPFFDVRELSPESRKIWGNISNQDYYDLWAASGFYAYTKTKPFFTSLVNKFRLAYIHLNAEHPEILAWGDAAAMALDTAVNIYNASIRACHRNYPFIKNGRFNMAYHDFCLDRVDKLWRDALTDLDPITKTGEFDKTEQRNIMLGQEQLEQQWLSEDSLFGSRIQAAEDYAELFRTKGTMKKFMGEFANRKVEFEKEVKK